MSHPMYRQIAEDLRAQIESGDLEPGQQLRTEIELREHYGASGNTIREAIKLLTAWGLVEIRPGQGTFVERTMEPYITILTGSPKVPRLYGEVDDSTADVTKGRERVFSSTDPQVEIQKAAASVASLLKIAEGSQVISRHQKRYIDGTPWSMQTSFYPMAFVRKGAERLIQADDIPVGTVRYLDQTLGLKQVGYSDWITVRAADATEVSFFNLPPDSRVSVFEVSRTAYDQTGTPMRLTISVYPTDRNQFKVNLGDVPAAAGSGDSHDHEPRQATPSTMPVTIYLSDEGIHEQVETAVEALLSAAGLAIEDRDDPVEGSWFRRMKATGEKVARSPMAHEAAMVAAHAADTRLVLAQDASVTATLMQNLGPVLGALQPTKDAIVRVGALLIVKVDWTVHVFQLTAAQQVKLDHNPRLSMSPHEIVQTLNLTDENRPGQGPAALDCL